MGPFDNEARAHQHQPDLVENAHWFLDQDGGLYIVADHAETEGPDTPTLDQINAIYRQHKSVEALDPIETAKRLGIEFVHPWQRRFDPQIGYFTA